MVPKMLLQKGRIMVRTLKPYEIELLDRELDNWTHHTNQLKLCTPNSKDWEDHLWKRKLSESIIAGTTGLTHKRLDDLLWKITNTATYWLPNGTIRKDH